MGVAILSTSKGLMTNRKARQMKMGGEILCHVW
jgi:small subunit ribosomal protein S8